MKNVPTPVPLFDEATATATEPTRHETTARTYCFSQHGEGGVRHLFSATRDYIATEPAPAASPPSDS
jgi:hypothetical protein